LLGARTVGGLILAACVSDDSATGTAALVGMLRSDFHWILQLAPGTFRSRLVLPFPRPDGPTSIPMNSLSYRGPQSAGGCRRTRTSIDPSLRRDADGRRERHGRGAQEDLIAILVGRRKRGNLAHGGSCLIGGGKHLPTAPPQALHGVL
jgi:hypothetical protein